MGKEFDYFKDYLKSNGLKLTKQREAILNMFLTKEGHVCSDELFH